MGQMIGAILTTPTAQGSAAIEATGRTNGRELVQVADLMSCHYRAINLGEEGLLIAA
jgi:hypothetical protein